jgi:SM-20-related protein
MTSLALKQAHSYPFSLETISNSPVYTDPYPYFIASSVLDSSFAEELKHDFPPIDRPGFFPLKESWRRGIFAQLLEALESYELAEILTQKLGIELRDKPRLITIRKWSAAKDGRIHNDSKAKIATSLLYLNNTWTDSGAGRLRVLRSLHSFDDPVAEISPLYGTFFAFRRTENSWHGHMPFVGERRVIQITWLQSWEEYERKQKRGRLSWLLKSFSKKY